jgi:hypothetical protein
VSPTVQVWKPAGEEVEFSVKDTTRGPQAVDVIRLKSYPPLVEI